MSQPVVGTGFHGSLTVIAVTNDSGPGTVGQASAPSGALDIRLPGVPTTVPFTVNTLVDIHDTAPTNDQWNYAAVEIVATHQ